jgi:Heterokaryon incompatibility protein (HET)
VYHVEVVTTEGDMASEFVLEPFQVQKVSSRRYLRLHSCFHYQQSDCLPSLTDSQAWSCHQTRKVDRTAVSFAEAFILIRIADVRECPQIAIFVDPWQMHADGDLELQSKSRFLADFKTNVSAGVLWNTADQHIPSREARPSRKRKRSGSLTNMDCDQADLSTSGQYIYQRLKLQQIRLLELLPGNDDDAIEGLVRPVCISENPKFRAISYAWGPALKPFNLHTAEGNIPLTSSLYAALKRLRSATESTFLWADAICIDQDNVHEKATQIRILPTIFQSAELVFAWIGNDEDDSYQALEALLQIRTNELEPDVWPVGLPPIPPEWQHPGLPQMDSEVWRHIVVLFQREWFRRAWIIQEIVLASEVKIICGPWEISWDDIFAAVKICLDWSSTLGVAHNRVREMLYSLKPPYTLAQTRTAFKKTQLSPRFNMMALLDEFAYTQSTKECDKLFALLGISSDAETAAFDPDYSSSIETIARRYAAEFISRGHAMDLLYRSGTSKSYSFSSWIPNWTSNEPCRTISTWRGAHGIFSAGGPPTEYARLDPDDGKHLQVTGAMIDTVIKTGQNTTADFDLITVINSLNEIVDGVGDYPTGESRQELLLKIPIGNAVKPCEDDIGSFQTAAEEDKDPSAIFQWNDSGSGIQSLQDMVEFFKQNREEREITWKYWLTAAAFLKRLSYGRFFVTQRGYIGVGPNTTKVHDQICVFAEGVVPFVVEQKSRTYRLVGECYVHGIMYGESSSFAEIRQQGFVLE